MSPAARKLPTITLNDTFFYTVVCTGLWLPGVNSAIWMDARFKHTIAVIQLRNWFGCPRPMLMSCGYPLQPFHRPINLHSTDCTCNASTTNKYTCDHLLKHSLREPFGLTIIYFIVFWSRLWGLEGSERSLTGWTQYVRNRLQAAVDLFYTGKWRCAFLEVMASNWR